MSDARAIAEETARASYGRLLAWLSARTRDVAAAEDALSDAFRAALETWPERGIPDTPEAWLVTAARRKLIDGARRDKTRLDKKPALTLAVEEAEAAAQEDNPFPDERLKLLFICAHPAIDAGVRTPLMLQTVLGLDAQKIASAFLISPAAMSGRLVRAKRKIKDAGISFEPPGQEELPTRVSAVLDAIYAAYGAGWDDAAGTAAGADNLSGEAIYLAKLVIALLPEDPEAHGLIALLLHAEARTKARRDDGQYVRLADQDADLWDRQMIAEAEGALAKAWRFQRPGRYQLEAAIQSAHVAARLHGRDTREDIVLLYDQLLKIAPSTGAEVSRAAALASADRLAEAFASLNAMPAKTVASYQPFWAVKAHVLRALEDKNAAAQAYDRAIGLTEDAATRGFLLKERAKL